MLTNCTGMFTFFFKTLRLIVNSYIGQRPPKRAKSRCVKKKKLVQSHCYSRFDVIAKNKTATDVRRITFARTRIGPVSMLRSVTLPYNIVYANGLLNPLELRRSHHHQYNICSSGPHLFSSLTFPWNLLRVHAYIYTFGRPLYKLSTPRRCKAIEA